VLDLLGNLENALLVVILQIVELAWFTIKIASGVQLQIKELEDANPSDLPDVLTPKLALALLMEVAHNALMIQIANGVEAMSFVLNSLILVEFNQLSITQHLAHVISITIALLAEKRKDVDGVKEFLHFAPMNYVLELLPLVANLIVKLLLLIVILAISFQDVLGVLPLKNV